MSTYDLGTAIALDFTWSTDSDDDGAVDDPTDPTTVTFQVEKPDGTVLTYVWGVDPNVDNPSTGRYVCTLTAAVLDLAGQYDYVATGTGDAEATYDGYFTMVANAIDSPAVAPDPTGVCGAWFDPTALAMRCRDVSADRLLGFAYAASEILFMATGQRFAGSCGPVTVRPCNHVGACGGQILSRGHLVPPTAWHPGGIDSVATCCDVSTVYLAGHPVRRIEEVMLDGVLLEEDVDYRLDVKRELVRLPDADGIARTWPGCARRDLPDTEPDTFSVTYTYGADPPHSGALAAEALAYELYAACPDTAGVCALPAGVRTVTRQGVTTQTGLIAEYLRDGSTGILAIDTFIGTWGSNHGGASVWSPDVAGYPHPVG